LTSLDEILARLGSLDQKDKDALVSQTMAATVAMRFIPNAGPQTDAYLSRADVLLYGGQAGGGKTYLELGWGINEAESGIIFRRERTQTDGLEKEGKKLIGNEARFNGQDLEWTWPSGKSLKLAGMNHPDSWIDHAGRERDYMAFDEGGEFLELQVAQIMAWLRGPPGKRVRVIIGSNPPRTSEGAWLLKWFAPWLDKKFPKPALPGEIRWGLYITDGDDTKIEWVDGPGEYEVDGQTYIAKSYTFIPAALKDNPDRDTPEYRAQLQSLPEPLRSQLLYGDFSVGVKDAPNQIIPTAWVRAAQARWTPQPPTTPEGMRIPMCAMAADCSGGGTDPLVIAARHDGWFAKNIRVPGKEIPQDRIGGYSAGIVVSHRKDLAPVIVDRGGGYGDSLFENLKFNGVDVFAYKGAEATTERTKDKKLGFTNKRTAVLWKFREALDPEQEGGSPIALPDDPLLTADLTAPTFEITPRGIKAESKEDVCERLGRSTDDGDAVVMCWSQGLKVQNIPGGWAKAQGIGLRGRKPAVVLKNPNRR
jgi:hypothetical protein